VRQYSQLQRILLYSALALLAYRLGPRVIPSIGEDGTIGLTCFSAILWWAATISMILFAILATRQLINLVRKPGWKKNKNLS
jgi:hypothetical protein